MKGQADLFGEHPLFFGTLLGVVGVLMALSAKDPVFNYAAAAVSGILFGRMMFHKRGRFFPFILLVIGFLTGYLIGSHIENWSRIVLVFLGGYFASFYLHDKGFAR